MTKKCTRCGETKPVDAFHRCTRYGRQHWCKACRKVYDAAYSKATLARRRERYAARAPEFRAWYDGLKANTPCADCGQIFPPPAMEWDHLPGAEKTANVADYKRQQARNRIIAEIANCELVCANCHAVRTFERRNGA